MKKQILLAILALNSFMLQAQEQATIYGFIRDSLRHPIDLANIAVKDATWGTMSTGDGYYEMKLPANTPLSIIISCIGYHPESQVIKLKPGARNEYNFTLKQDIKTFREVAISARQNRASTFQHIDVRNLNYMPSTAGKVETIIKSQAGVNSNNELSSQYSVRGGNYDENLVYVNDVEIYRPFLVRSGQQEGLSFINSDLVSDIKFSAGGYEARYGDKMSSALDITYKRPTEFSGSASISLLGASTHIEGASKNQKFTYLAGYRYKTTSYLLNTLETEGEYKPQFSDLQAQFNYYFNSKFSVSFLGNYSANKYQFIPETRRTQFGTLQNPFDFNIYYDGQEVDQFDTFLEALTFTWQATERLKLMLIGTTFQTREQETFDIRGQYWINQLDNTAGSETFGDSTMNIGVGTMHEHARNYLNAYVYGIEHIGEWKNDQHLLKWGVKYQYQEFYDNVSEWELIDSAGYVIPYSGKNIILNNTRHASNYLAYDQLNAFIQDTWEMNLNSANLFLNGGLRASLWNFNKTLLWSPRMTVSIQPHWKKDMMFHLSGGVYYQPPFYKEMRMSNDEINTNIEPQRSIHLLLGGDYIFTAWDRPFKLSSEIYYKWLDNLIPYKIDNVRINYSGENIAEGYSRGIDLKINGEFVAGTESWFTLSLLQSKEDITGDSIMVLVDTENLIFEQQAAGHYPRPSEQILSTGVFFQDYLPEFPDYKVHLSAYFATGVPTSSPIENQYYSTHRLKPYKRVDIGFSKVLKREYQELSDKNPLRNFKSVWLSAEVFNMFGFNNEESLSWIRTVSNQQGEIGMFAIPNYLTGRLFNIKLTANF